VRQTRQTGQNEANEANETDMQPRRWLFEFRRGGTAYPGRVIAISRTHTKRRLRTKRYKSEGAASLLPDFDP
jgi:hypothetical protein